MSRTRIRFPMRGRACDHLQTFDLLDFLEGRMTLTTQSLLCPVCEMPLRLDDLVCCGRTLLALLIGRPDDVPLDAAMLFGEAAAEGVKKAATDATKSPPLVPTQRPATLLQGIHHRRKRARTEEASEQVAAQGSKQPSLSALEAVTTGLGRSAGGATSARPVKVFDLLTEYGELPSGLRRYDGELPQVMVGALDLRNMLRCLERYWSEPSLVEALLSAVDAVTASMLLVRTVNRFGIVSVRHTGCRLTAGLRAVVIVRDAPAVLLRMIKNIVRIRSAQPRIFPDNAEADMRVIRTLVNVLTLAERFCMEPKLPHHSQQIKIVLAILRIHMGDLMMASYCVDAVGLIVSCVLRRRPLPSTERRTLCRQIVDDTSIVELLLRASRIYDATWLDDKIKAVVRRLSWPSGYTISEVMALFARTGVFVPLSAAADMMRREAVAVESQTQKEMEASMYGHMRDCDGGHLGAPTEAWIRAVTLMMTVVRDGSETSMDTILDKVEMVCTANRQRMPDLRGELNELAHVNDSGVWELRSDYSHALDFLDSGVASRSPPQTSPPRKADVAATPTPVAGQ